MIKGNRVILPSDVIKQIIKHWYRVIIVTIIIALVLTGYFFLDDKKKVEEQNEADAKTKYYDVNEFSNDELNQAQNAVDAYDVLTKTQNYYDNSFIQKMDPFAVKQTVLYYKVEIDSSKIPENQIGQEGNLAAALRPEYFYYVSRGDLGTDVAKKVGIDAQYITELLSVENDGNVCFNVIIRGTDQIPNFVQLVKDTLEEYRAELEISHNIHKLVINNEFESVIRIDDYYNRQRNSVTELNTCNYNLNNLLKQMNMEQVAYYNDKTGNEYKYINPDTGKEEVYVSIGTSGLIKRGIISVVIGIVLACIVEMFIFMYSRKIISESDYSISMGIVVLGNDSNDEEKRITSTKVRNMCLKDEIKKIVIASSEEKLIKNNIVNTIESDLVSEGVDVIVMSNFLSDYKKVNDVQMAGNLILIEGVGVSCFEKISDIADFCEDYNINLLGVVNSTV